MENASRYTLLEQTCTACLPVYYPPGEAEAARLVAGACERSQLLTRDRWGLPDPPDCRIYIATGWREFLFQAAPGAWKALLLLNYPLIARRSAAIWPMAGGLAFSFGRRKAVGVKPPHLLEKSDTRMGQQIYLPNPDLNEKVQTITCHELVHAYTSHLKLPPWLNEGLATLGMEHFLGVPLVRQDTLDRAELFTGRPGRSQSLWRAQNPQDMVAVYVFGYWLVRHIEEMRPELLRELLARRWPRARLEEKVAASFGKTRQDFWQQVGEELRSAYGHG